VQRCVRSSELSLTFANDSDNCKRKSFRCVGHGFKLNESSQALKDGRTSLEDELSRGRRKEGNVRQETRVEAGSNTSTVNLRVVRGDEMGLKKAAP
jgi:hypothetical protein